MSGDVCAEPPATTCNRTATAAGGHALAAFTRAQISRIKRCRVWSGKYDDDAAGLDASDGNARPARRSGYGCDAPTATSAKRSGGSATISTRNCHGLVDARATAARPFSEVSLIILIDGINTIFAQDARGGEGRIT